MKISTNEIEKFIIHEGINVKVDESKLGELLTTKEEFEKLEDFYFRELPNFDGAVHNLRGMGTYLAIIDLLKEKQKK